MLLETNANSALAAADVLGSASGAIAGAHVKTLAASLGISNNSATPHANISMDENEYP